MPQVAIAAVGLAVATVGTVASISNQRKMIKEQQKASRFERQKNELQSSRQKLEVIRQTRSAYATAQQHAENQGVANSSSAQGGQGSIFSQGLANLSFLDNYGFYSDQAGKALEKAMHYGSNASMWGSIAELGSTVYSMSGGIPHGGGGGAKGPTPPSPSELGLDSSFWNTFNKTIR